MGENSIITINTIIKRNEAKFLANALGEEMVMMNMENGDFISLNQVGADIWKLTQEAVSVADLVMKLLQLYNISESQCINETLSFLQKTLDQKIFLIQNA